MKVSTRDLDYLINHLFLPPKLPQQYDEEYGSLALLTLFEEVVGDFATLSTSPNKLEWDSILKSMPAWRELNSPKAMSEEGIASRMLSMVPNDVLALCVRSQNAAILLRTTTQGTIFETFELSPTSEAVIGAKAALIRVFPARAVLVPFEVMKDSSFCGEFAKAVSRLSNEQVDEVMPHSRKAGHEVTETRDTADPNLITELLFSLLESRGNFITTKFIQKRTRDDVCWNMAQLPWRRSPLWLMLKVALQITLANSAISDTSQLQYKNILLFFLGKVARLALQKSLSADVLHVINVKLAIRLAKLKDETAEFVRVSILETVTAIKSQMQAKWSHIQSLSTKSQNICPQGEISTALGLVRSTPAIQNVLQRARLSVESAWPELDLTWMKRGHFHFSSLPSANHFDHIDGDSIFFLTDFECWVSKHLDKWLEQSSRSADDGEKLKSIGEKYLRLASPLYEGNPEQKSVMLLTLIELWIAIDKIVVHLYPLVSHYSPEIPTSFLVPLLLARNAELQRLQNAEKYLEQRHELASKEGKPSIFTTLKHDSFAVVFYDRDTSLVALSRRITGDAEEARTVKVSEWRSSKAKYEDLTAQVASLKCEYLQDRWGWDYHKSSCRKCELENQASKLEIRVHEWPLPSNDNKRKAVVFELAKPNVIGAWRDITWTITHTLGREKKAKGPAYGEILTEYDPLKRYHSSESGSLSLASTSKRFTRSHYATKKFPVELSSVCVSNALDYDYYDSHPYALEGTPVPTWTHSQTMTPSISRFCIFQIEDPRFENLQFSLDSTTHGDNNAQAKQSECSAELSRHEYLAFASLRAGERLQWLNIARELESFDFDLNSSAVLKLFTQSAWQAGTAGASSLCGLRQAHSIFAEPRFCVLLAAIIDKKLSQIEANWKEVDSMSLLLMLLLRLISLAQHHHDRAQWYQILRRIRSSALQWVKEISRILRTERSQDYTQDEEDRNRILRAALLCRSTYFVDLEHLDAILHDDEDVSVLVQCSIAIYDNRPPKTSGLSASMKNDLLKDRKLSVLLESRIHSLLRSGNCGISQGITAIWKSSSFASTWSSVPANDSSWIMNRTNVRPQTVHYNILTGALLVNGSPLGRLPRAYTEGSLYQRIFGSRVLDVLASDLVDMQYMTAHPDSGKFLYFKMMGPELVIRERRGDLTYEVIPHTNFEGDLPALYVENFVHWIELTTGSIEFRDSTEHNDLADHGDLGEPWVTSQFPWVLSFDETCPSSSVMRCDSHWIVDSNSKLGDYFCSLLENFENRPYIHITLSNNKLVEVKLPRFRLHFFQNRQGQLQSSDMSAIYDKDQTLGTLNGLRSRLVLRDLGERTGSFKRMVLIPFGDVSLEKGGDHVGVSITASGNAKRSYFQYEVSQVLKELRSGPDLLSHLFKAYLHAITSYVLPDALTEQTGTYQAIRSLHEAACKVSTTLSSDTLELLSKIAKISPVREFYPNYLRVMQKTTWHNVLSPVVQHSCLQVLAEDIIRYNERFAFLHSNGQRTAVEDIRHGGNLELLQRALYRCSTLYSVDSYDCKSSGVEDNLYRSRDREVSVKQKASFEISSLIRDWPANFPVITELYDALKSLGSINGFDQPFEITHYTDLLNLSIGRHWGSLYKYCTSSKRPKDTYPMTFTFGAIAFGQPDLLPHLRTLLAFATNEHLRSLVGPSSSSYDLSRGYELQSKIVQAVVTRHKRAFQPMFSEAAKNMAASKEHDTETGRQAQLVIRTILNGWPRRTVRLPASTQVPNIDLAGVSTGLSSNFDQWYENHLFHEKCLSFEESLQEVNLNSLLTTAYLSRLTAWPQLRYDLHKKLTPSLLECFQTRDIEPIGGTAMADPCESELGQIFQRFQASFDATRKQYGEDLRASLIALAGVKLNSATMEAGSPNLRDLEDQIHDSQHQLKVLIGRLLAATRPIEWWSKPLCLVGIWPRVTPKSLLQYLSFAARESVPGPWLQAIIAFANEITILQRHIRLLAHVESRNELAVREELSNKGHEAWDPTEQPDWLLLEIERNFLIRPTQIKVAQEMIAPASGKSTAVQLNMGEGKSSVIIPMVTTACANGTQLSRIIVLKPQAKYMLRQLSQQLGGLINRPLFHMPFSRKVPLDLAVSKRIESLYRDCKEYRGVLLVIPDHILSFQLAGIDKLYAGEVKLASSLLSTQRWLWANARDVLDECDEILSVNFELVYTVGNQKHMDHQPIRWTLIGAMLGLVRKRANELKRSYPKAVELDDQDACAFPHLRILQPEAGNQLLRMIVDDIRDGRLSDVAFEHCPSNIRIAVLEFISIRSVSEETAGEVMRYFDKSLHLSTIFLLRGLIAHRILLFGLESKRFLVNYGLDPGRSLLAVPYRSKGVPSLSAEFGHPDIALILTFLSYYYTGLEEHQLRRCVSLLFKMTDPADEYGRWIANSQLPGEFRSLNSINLDDSKYVVRLHTYLKHSQAMTDFFLKSCVFPQEGKEFLWKLSSSAWDLLSNEHLTTGFSGTQDSKPLLPLSIEQRNLHELSHTNAMVLQTLLRPENRTYLCAEDAHKQRLSVEALLQLVVKQRPSIHVLIDVGAQVLDLDNRFVARKWLELNNEKTAVVYFDRDDEAMVLDKSSNEEMLMTSPYRHSLEDCLIYLDEAHTRGTDFKLPVTIRAAVTLGPNLTKDPLIQGCMRLRKLGSGQSFLCLAPPEVDQSIRNFVSKPSETLDVADVITWCLEQTCRSVKRSRPLWIVRGLGYLKRRFAEKDFAVSPDCTSGFQEFLDIVCEKESWPVVEMYKPIHGSKDKPQYEFDSHQVKDPGVHQLLSELSQLDHTAVQDSEISEEQQREVALEVEAEKEIQRPMPLDPKIHRLSKGIEEFVQHGNIGSLKQLDAFSSLRTSSAGLSLETNGWAKTLLVTRDYVRTVKVRGNAMTDEYIRPVRWILSNVTDEKLLIISPFEADELLPQISQSKYVALHIYSPRVSRGMRSFDALDFHVISGSQQSRPIAGKSRLLLNIFAGQLYLNDFRDYMRLCEHLGVLDGTRELTEQAWEVQSDGFVSASSRELHGWHSTFCRSPVPFVEKLLGIRRKGEDFAGTDMGKILSGRTLKVVDFPDLD